MNDLDTEGPERSPLDAATRALQVAASLREGSGTSARRPDRLEDLAVWAARMSELPRIVAQLSAQSAALEARSATEEARSSRLAEQLGATLARQVGLFLGDLRGAYRRLVLWAAILVLAQLGIAFLGHRGPCSLEGGRSHQTSGSADDAAGGDAAATMKRGRATTTEGRHR